MIIEKMDDEQLNELSTPDRLVHDYVRSSALGNSELVYVPHPNIAIIRDAQSDKEKVTARRSHPIMKFFAPMRGKRADQAQARLDAVKMYDLLDPVFDELRWRLLALWGSQRLIQALDRDNNAVLREAIVTYHRDMTEVLATVHEVESSTIVSEVARVLVDDLQYKKNEIVDDAASVIESLFAKSEAARERKRKMAEEQAEHEGFIKNTESSLNNKLDNQLLIDKALRIITDN